jgi:radical SAM superfamily enzyme YgiQ (UPF0313 family)
MGKVMDWLGLIPKVIARPLGLSYLSACLKRAGHECEVLDLHTCPASKRVAVLLQTIRQRSYDFIGFSFLTHGCPEALKLAEACRQHSPNSRIVFGGPHASFAQKQLLAHNFVDFVVAGEAENSFIRLVAGDAPATIPGVASRQSDGVISNAPEVIDNLDSLPFPDRKACVPIHYRYMPIDYLQTSRGCPRQCSFCVESRIFKKVRLREPQAVVEEMHALAAEGKKLLYLADSNFSASREHLHAVCREVRRRKPNVQLFTEMAVEFTDTEMLKAIAASCFAGVTFGIESLSEPSLKEIGKTGTGESYRRKAETLLRYCNRIGLSCSCYYIVPLRYQDRSSVLNEIKFLQTFGQVELMFLTPYPGTRLWDEASNALITRDLSKYDSYHVVYNPSEMSQNDLAEIYRQTVRHNRRSYAAKQSAGSHKVRAESLVVN